MTRTQLLHESPVPTCSTSAPPGSAQENDILSDATGPRQHGAPGDHVMPDGNTSSSTTTTTTTKKRKRSDPSSMRLPTFLQSHRKVKQQPGKHVRFDTDTNTDTDTDRDRAVGTHAASSSAHRKKARKPFPLPRPRGLQDVDVESQNDHLANALWNACDEIRALKSEVAQSASKAASEERVVRQQMLFDFMLKQDQTKKECERTSARYMRMAAGMKCEMEKKVLAMEELKKMADLDRRQDRAARDKLLQQYTAERNKYLNALSTSNFYQTTLEHYQNLLKTAEEDLAELQRIHNEEKAIKLRATRGLPPAYGSLDDVEVTPPWAKHEDGGSLDMAQIKHTVRHRFTRDLHNAHSLANTYRESQDMRLKVTAGVELFRLSSLALQEACVSLREILDIADDVDISPRSKKRQKRRQGRTFEEQHQEPVPRRVYIAERTAKLVLDLAWRLISVFYLRPQDIRLTPQLKTELGLYWRKIDDVFVEAVKATFHATSPEQRSDENDEPLHRPGGLCPQCKSNECPGHCVRVTELQVFLTHLKNVSKRLEQITNSSELRGTYFVESYEWLTESVETERRLAANTAMPSFPAICPQVSHLAGHGSGASLADAALMARLNERSAPDDDTATVPDENIDALAEQAAQVEREGLARRAGSRDATAHELDIIQRARDRAFANDPVLQDFFSGPSGRRALAEDAFAWREVSRDESAGTRTLRRTDGERSELRLERVPPVPPTGPVSRPLLRGGSADSGAYDLTRDTREAFHAMNRALSARYSPGGDIHGRS